MSGHQRVESLFLRPCQQLINPKHVPRAVRRSIVDAGAAADRLHYSEALTTDPIDINVSRMAGGGLHQGRFVRDRRRRQARHGEAGKKLNDRRRRPCPAARPSALKLAGCESRTSRRKREAMGRTALDSQLGDLLVLASPIDSSNPRIRYFGMLNSWRPGPRKYRTNETLKLGGGSLEFFGGGGLLF